MIKTIKYSVPISARLYSQVSGKPSHNENFQAVNSPRKSQSQKKKEAAQLANASLSDIFDFLSQNTPEELEIREEVNLDSILKNPKSFKKLTFNQKNVVFETLEQYKLKQWTEVPMEIKSLMYYVSYGNWGPRGSFADPLSPDYIPEDLPFTPFSNKDLFGNKDPLETKDQRPKKEHPVKRLPPVNLMSVTKEREKEFNQSVRKLDPASQAAVIFGFLVTGLAILGDVFRNEKVEKIEDFGQLESTIGNADHDPETVEMIEDYELRRLRRATLAKGATSEEGNKDTQDGNGDSGNESRKTGKKWYYLWLF